MPCVGSYGQNAVRLAEIDSPRKMNITETHTTRPRCRARVKSGAAAWKLTKWSTRVLAFGALWMLAATCLASEPPVSVVHFPHHASPAAGISYDRRFEFVIVQSQGWGPHGFKFQIWLGSPMQGPGSSLALSAGESGLVVTARDVDGVGNDLDLIIKTAKSFTPIGVWINNHRGGFTKADSRIYAKSIWADCPLLLGFTPPEARQRAVLSVSQSCVYPLQQSWSYRSRTSGGAVEPSNFDRPSHPAADRQTTRGPPACH